MIRQDNIIETNFKDNPPIGRFDRERKSTKQFKNTNTQQKIGSNEKDSQNCDNKSNSSQDSPGDKNKFDPDNYYVQLRQRFSKTAKKEEGNYEKTAKQSHQINSLDLYSPRNTHNLICVKEIDAGNAFGELALLSNKPRLATIVCLEDCQFAILEKEDFSKILKQIEEKLLEKEISFLANLHIFQSWNKNLLKQLYLNSQRVNFNRGQIIFNEGDICENVYIVSQGEFTVIFLFQIFLEQQIFEFTYINPVLIPKNNIIWDYWNYFELIGGFKMFEFNRDKERSEQSEQELETGTTLDQFNQVHGSQRQVEVIQIKTSILTPYEMFGEEDLLLKQDRSYSVKCSSMNGQLIVIRNRNFNMRILQDDYTKKYLYDRLENKQKAFEKRAQKIIEQYRKYKKYLISSTNNLFDVCIESIKKQSNESTDYHQTQVEQSFPSSLKQIEESSVKKIDQDQQYNSILDQNGENIHMLQKVLNYDLKYHRQSLQRGLLGVHTKEVKENSIRKNQKEVNIEMQHYAQQFNQYEPDKFINMNKQEEKNNEEYYLKYSTEKKAQKDSSSKSQRSKSVITLKNETRDQLLNQYRQIIYEQSSIHFKIKCNQAQKPKSDRTKINYLQVMREKEEKINQTQELVPKRKRIMSANNAINTDKKIISVKQLGRQTENYQSTNMGSSFSSKTEISPEKNQFKYYSVRPPNQKVSLIDEFETESSKKEDSVIQSKEENKYNFNEKEKKADDQNQINNQGTQNIKEQCYIDNNAFQLLKIYPNQKEQKFITVKQQPYITTFFLNGKSKQILSRTQSQNQIYKSQQNLVNPQTKFNTSNQSPEKKSSIMIKKRSVSVQTPYKQNENQLGNTQVNENSEEKVKKKNYSRIENQSKQQIINIPLKPNDQIQHDNIKKAYLPLQDQLRKPKWKYEKFDIIGNIKQFGNMNKKDKIQQKNELPSFKFEQQQLWQTQIVSKLGQKK